LEKTGVFVILNIDVFSFDYLKEINGVLLTD